MTATLDRSSESGGDPTRKGPKPILSGRRGLGSQISVYAGVIVPLVALIAAVPFALSVRLL